MSARDPATGSRPTQAKGWSLSPSRVRQSFNARRSPSPSTSTPAPSATRISSPSTTTSFFVTAPLRIRRSLSASGCIRKVMHGTSLLQTSSSSSTILCTMQAAIPWIPCMSGSGPTMSSAIRTTSAPGRLAISRTAGTGIPIPSVWVIRSITTASRHPPLLTATSG